jgi:hypothetical protein
MAGRTTERFSAAVGTFDGIKVFPTAGGKIAELRIFQPGLRGVALQQFLWCRLDGTIGKNSGNQKDESGHGCSPG